jgi:hypothetical protein
VNPEPRKYFAPPGFTKLFMSQDLQGRAPITIVRAFATTAAVESTRSTQEPIVSFATFTMIACLFQSSAEGFRQGLSALVEMCCEVRQ